MSRSRYYPGRRRRPGDRYGKPLPGMPDLAREWHEFHDIVDVYRQRLDYTRDTVAELDARSQRWHGNRRMRRIALRALELLDRRHWVVVTVTV